MPNPELGVGARMGHPDGTTSTIVQSICYLDEIAS